MDGNSEIGAHAWNRNLKSGSDFIKFIPFIFRLIFELYNIQIVEKSKNIWNNIFNRTKIDFKGILDLGFMTGS